MTRVLLIRHAEHDALGRYLAGVRGGLTLNAAGRARLPALVAALHDIPLAAVVSSPLERTRETAGPVARDHGLPMELNDAFLEFDVGEWTGRPFATLVETEEWQRFNRVRSLTAAPGGELMLGVQDRAVNALLDLRARYPSGIVAVFAHGDVIRAVLLYLLGMPIDFLHRLEISPARISIVELDEDSVVVLQVNGETATASTIPAL
jgi:broad specificity phosphatase PhoE